MKPTDLRDLTETELAEHVKTARRDLLGLRFRAARRAAGPRRHRSDPDAWPYRHGEDPARRLHRAGKP